MTIGQGNKPDSTDKSIFYARFLAIVKDPTIGVGPTHANIIWWWPGSGMTHYPGTPYRSPTGGPFLPFPPATSHNLGNKTFPTSDPASVASVQGTKISRASFVNPTTIFDTLHNYARQLTRVRNTVWTYKRNPGPDELGPATPALAALSISHIYNLLPKPPEPAFAVGTKISTADIDVFMTNLKANLDAYRAANPVTITMCHSSCHSSCHGARGRR